MGRRTHLLGRVDNRSIVPACQLRPGRVRRRFDQKVTKSDPLEITKTLYNVDQVAAAYAMANFAGC